jgi:hypothetical protein
MSRTPDDWQSAWNYVILLGLAAVLAGTMYVLFEWQ